MYACGMCVDSPFHHPYTRTLVLVGERAQGACVAECEVHLGGVLVMVCVRVLLADTKWLAKDNDRKFLSWPL